MQCFVVRESGDNQGEDQINEYATDYSAGRELGRNYLDANGFDKTYYTFQTPYLDFPAVGKIAEVIDASIGQRFKAKIAGWTISATQMTSRDPVSITCNIEVERSDT